MENEKGTATKNVLEQLAFHFNQEIHTVEFDSLEDIPQPYFDQGKDPELSPTLKYWLNEVLPLSPTIKDIAEWIEGYETTVRPLILKSLSSATSSSSSSLGYIPILQNYEVILAQLSSRFITAINSREDNKLNIMKSAITNQATANIDILSKTMYKIVRLVSTDITLLTSEGYFSALPSTIRSNVVLPTLLRILQNILQVLYYFPLDDEDLENISSLRRCAVTLLAFDGTSISPCQVAPSILDPTRHCIDVLCCCPLNTTQHFFSQEEIKELNKCFDLRYVDWDSAIFSTNGWNDPNSGIATRISKAVWMHLDGLVSQKYYSNHEFISLTVCQEQVQALKSEGNLTKLQQTIIEKLGGMDVFIADVRTHFFGRDMYGWKPDMHTSQQVVLGRRVTTSQPMVKDLPFQAVPSRIVVAINALKFLSAELPKTACITIVGDVFPICASLVDSNRSMEIGLGASGFLRLMDFMKKQQVWLSDLGDYSQTFIQNTFSVLDMALRASRESPVVVTIGLAQCDMLDLCEKSSENLKDFDHRKQRRKVSNQWLNTLSRFSYQSMSDSKCWEVIVGGALPLLRQHAHFASSADALELGRLGLTALLPFIDEEIVSNDKVQVVTMIALINLLFSAYPVMPHHGGKIVSYLLAFAAGASSDSAIQKLSLYTAALALVICGPTLAGQTIRSIIEDQDSYQDKLVAAASKVCALAETIEQR